MDILHEMHPLLPMRLPVYFGFYEEGNAMVYRLTKDQQIHNYTALYHAL